MSIRNMPGFFVSDEGLILRACQSLNVIGSAKGSASVAISGGVATVTVKNRRATLTGGVTNVGASATTVATFCTVSNELTMPYAGRIVAMAIKLNTPRTAGTLLVRGLLNGVGGSSAITLDATHTTSGFAILGTPIDFVAGDTIGIETQTVGFAPTGADATLTLVFELYTEP